MDDYSMGIVLQDASKTKTSSFVKNERQTQATTEGFSIANQTPFREQNIKSDSNFIESIQPNTEKPLDNRKKHYEEFNSSHTSNRRRFLPIDL